jgi:hypothetical protein
VNSGRAPAGNFVSGSLGPLLPVHLVYLKEQEFHLSKNSTLEGTKAFKYVGAPVLREAGLYSSPHKIGIEIRQWDTPSVGQSPLEGRAVHLLQSLEFTQAFLDGALEADFALNPTPFSIEPIANQLEIDVCLALGKLATTAKHLETELSISQNLLWPLRPFSKCQWFEESPQSMEQLQIAQSSYRTFLSTAHNKILDIFGTFDFSKSVLSQEWASDQRKTLVHLLNETRCQLASFAAQSGLSGTIRQNFERRRNKLKRNKVQ